MAEEWDPLSKANKSGIIIEMGKKIKVGVTVSFVHFSSCRFEQVDVRFQKFVLIIYISAITYYSNIGSTNTTSNINKLNEAILKCPSST
jgi:hypothetical protein